MKEILTEYTLGELLGSEDETIRRNAMSILKQLQRREAHKHDTNYEKMGIKIVEK